ncbi:DUF1330 domain-containing protein [Rhodococcus spongiicola]|uniref:DUF1330 domain-containing protein n=1 Tax=Rhodococcus spongiicola TaxID=2487352 RepID=A0A3S3E637_9NOCA|nr:DUF1330 domain-containing protein [Rhodococcus spongiicola]RVW06199.1 DUF1330 domain-containing protein [Rhodococcus spongiicola]
MQVENAVYPSVERIGALGAVESGEPVVMLNLLRFRDKAVYSDGRSTALTGREAYQIYATAMQKIVEENGGRFVFLGQINSLVIGEVEDMWDFCALVEYPSAADFVRIATLPEVAEIGVHRTAGLAGQLLIRVAQT